MRTHGPAGRAALIALAALGLALPAGAGDKTPVTTTSEEARRRYLEGREFCEKLRGTDGRARFEQAAAKDANFALAQVGLANTAPSAKEFFAALERAVALKDKASPSEQLIICSLDAGAKGDVARQKECLTKLV